MSGDVSAGAPRGQDGDGFRRWKAEVEATLADLVSRTRGPIQGWGYGRDQYDRPTIVAPDGVSHGIASTTANGQTLDELADRVDDIERRALPSGWQLFDDGDGVPRVRLPDGREFILQPAIGSFPAPLWVYGDSNTTDSNTVVPGVVPWPKLVSPSIRNAGVNGRGWAFVAPGQRTIGADIQATPQPFGTAVMCCGINDIAQGVSVATIEAEIASAVIYASVFAQRVIIATILPVTGGFAGYNANRVTINNWIRSTYSGAGPWASRVFALDLAGAVEATPNGALDAGYSFDGLHLNQAGHNAVAAYFHSVLHLG